MRSFLRPITHSKRAPEACFEPRKRYAGRVLRLGLGQISSDILRKRTTMHLSQRLQGYNVGTSSHDLEAFKCLFALPEAELSNWPGILALFRYLEKSFQPLLAEEYASIFSLVALQRPESTAECWPCFTLVFTKIRGQQNGRRASIEDIYDSLSSPGNCTTVQEHTAQEKTASLIAIFSILCWATMVLQPKLGWSDDFQGSPSLMVHEFQSGPPGLKMDQVRRPIAALFNQFKRTMLTTRWRHPITEVASESSISLHLSTLNYASLNVIGKIHIAWTDSLTSHLDFDATQRRLSVFRFPSFCALSVLATGQGSEVTVG